MLWWPPAPPAGAGGPAVTGRGIVREHQDLFLNGEKIGQTTSGTHCPFLGKALAMGLIDAKYAAVGTALEADVRGRRVAVEIVPCPSTSGAERAGPV